MGPTEHWLGTPTVSYVKEGDKYSIISGTSITHHSLWSRFSLWLAYDFLSSMYLVNPHSRFFYVFSWHNFIVERQSLLNNSHMQHEENTYKIVVKFMLSYRTQGENRKLYSQMLVLLTASQKSAKRI